MAITKAQLQLVHEQFGEKVKQTIVNQRDRITQLLDQVALTERQVRDLVRENDRLRRLNSALRSGGAGDA